MHDLHPSLRVWRVATVMILLVFPWRLGAYEGKIKHQPRRGGGRTARSNHPIAKPRIYPQLLAMPGVLT
jgi:hypothetical protein